MIEYSPAFKDDRDKLITLGMFVCSMFFFLFPPLIVLFIPKEYISENTYQIAKTLFNFELLLFLISLCFLVPIIGWLAAFVVAPILEIWNIVVIVMAICAIAGNNTIKLPAIFKFI